LHALEGMTQLTALNLSHNRLSDVGMKSLAGLTNLQSLDVDDLLTSNMRITDEGIKQLPQLKELRELSLAGLKISGKNLAFPHLQSLDLSGDLVTDAALDNIVQCREMRHLGLSWTRISDAGLKRVASLKELRSLSLTSKLITDDGIAHLTDLPNLEHIEMHVTQMSDESLRHLSQIKSLTRLDLFGSEEGFTIQGLQQLKNLPHLRELWINNFTSSDSFMGLSELKQLNSLILFFTNIRDEEAKQLEAAMPDTNISAGSSRITVTGKK
jgi:Leucine-rich repeat (LRR) protein